MMQDCPKLAMANFRWIGPCHFGLLGAMKVQRRQGATLEMASQKLAMANFDANQGLRQLDFVDSMKAPKRTRALPGLSGLRSAAGMARSTKRQAPR
jgi:hypothetical protein